MVFLMWSPVRVGFGEHHFRDLVKVRSVGQRPSEKAVDKAHD